MRTAVQVNPQDVQARFYLGTCLMRMGEPARAAEQFHAARDVDPAYSQAWRAEVLALDSAGDKTAAARVRTELAAAKPQD